MVNLAETRIIKLMKELVKRNGSDLHLTGDTLPFFRIQGQMMPADSLPITSLVLKDELELICLLYTSPSPRDLSTSRMPSSA